MGDFLAACLSFPTVVFSLFLCLALLYWLCVLAGALDLDVFDLDVDAGADLGVDGDVDVEAGDSHGVFADILQRFDLTEIPLTVSASLFLLTAWLTSFTLVELGGAWTTAFVWGSVVAVASATASLFVTSRLARVLKPLFRTHVAPRRSSLIGQVCEITTLRVDDDYGQAEVQDGGAGLLIQVRSSNADQLSRGSAALIFDYDADREVFHVKPMEAAAAVDDGVLVATRQEG